MAEIVELIAADHLHIMRWQLRLAELRHRAEPSQTLALVTTWDTLSGLIGLHMAADEEVCAPAICGTGPAGLDPGPGGQGRARGHPRDHPRDQPVSARLAAVVGPGHRGPGRLDPVPAP